MGTDCAPFLANLFLFSLEFRWILTQVKAKKFFLLKKFHHCSRYIDDLLLVNNDNVMKKVCEKMYPKELILVPDDSDGLSAPFLDLQMDIKDGVVTTSIFDKRDAFDFPIVNFPNLSGNIPSKSSYGTFVGACVRFARGCTYLDNFQHKVCELTKRLLTQNFTKRHLCSSWRKFAESHVLTIQKFGQEVLNMESHNL